MPVPTVPGSLLEEVACPLCSSPDGRPRHAHLQWRYRTCDRCGFVYLSPRPTASALRALYQDYLPASTVDVAAWARMMEPVHRDLLARATRANGGPGRVCDVGCGHGHLLERFARRGWQGWGVEVNASAAAEAVRRSGGEIRVGSIEEMVGLEGRFDVVTACYVIEHLPDPPAFLRLARRLLRPGGHLILRWPHTTPLCDLLAYTPWRPNLYDAPWHLVDFSPVTMERALRSSGFAEVGTFTGGWTRPPTRLAALASAIGGSVSEGITRLTPGRTGLPGVSKTTVARRGGGPN